MAEIKDINLVAFVVRKDGNIDKASTIKKFEMHLNEFIAIYESSVEDIRETICDFFIRFPHVRANKKALVSHVQISMKSSGDVLCNRINEVIFEMTQANLIVYDTDKKVYQTTDKFKKLFLEAT